MTVDEEHLKQPKGKTHAQNRSAFLHSAVYAGHDLWQTVGVVWCKRCGYYTRRNLQKLKEECPGWMPPSRAKIFAKLIAGRVPKAKSQYNLLKTRVETAGMTVDEEHLKQPKCDHHAQNRSAVLHSAVYGGPQTQQPEEADESDLGPGEEVQEKSQPP